MLSLKNSNTNLLAVENPNGQDSLARFVVVVCVVGIGAPRSTVPSRGADHQLVTPASVTTQSVS